MAATGRLSVRTGRSGGRVAGTSPPSPSGPRGRRAGRNVPPASTATTSPSPRSGRSRSRSLGAALGPHGDVAAGLSHPRGDPRARGHGVVGARRRGARAPRRAAAGGPGPGELRPRIDDSEPPDSDAGRRPRFAFWDNFEQRSPEDGPWPPSGPLPPTWRNWVRYRPTATFDDPWLDAARSLVVLDVGSWPSGSRPHAYRNPPYIAPSLDLYAAFHGPGQRSDWLLLDAHSPLAQDGMLAWTGRVWSEDRRLLASGGGQALFRRMGRSRRVNWVHAGSWRDEGDRDDSDVDSDAVFHSVGRECGHQDPVVRAVAADASDRARLSSFNSSRLLDTSKLSAEPDEALRCRPCQSADRSTLKAIASG